MPGFPIVTKAEGFGTVDRVVEDPDADLEYVQAQDEGEGFAGVEGGRVGPQGAWGDVKLWSRPGHVCLETRYPAKRLDGSLKSTRFAAGEEE